MISEKTSLMKTTRAISAFLTRDSSSLIRRPWHRTSFTCKPLPAGASVQAHPAGSGNRHQLFQATCASSLYSAPLGSKDCCQEPNHYSHDEKTMSGTYLIRQLGLPKMSPFPPVHRVSSAILARGTGPQAIASLYPLMPAGWNAISTATQRA